MNLRLTYSLDVVGLDCLYAFGRPVMTSTLVGLIFRRPDGRRFKLNVEEEISSGLLGSSLDENKRTVTFCQSYKGLSVDSLDNDKFVKSTDVDVVRGLMNNYNRYTHSYDSKENSIHIESMEFLVETIDENLNKKNIKETISLKEVVYFEMVSYKDIYEDIVFCVLGNEKLENVKGIFI